MAKNKDADPAGPADANQRYVTAPEDIAKAKKWFDRARDLGEKRQFDYAVEYYVSGLEFWPDAVEEACKALHGCAVARKQTGGKKPGFGDTMKRSMTDKNPKQAFANSLWLFGRDPDNPQYIEGVLKSAAKLGADDAAKWAAGVYFRVLETNPKSAGKQYQPLVQALDELGERAASRAEHSLAVETFQMGVEVVNAWRRRAGGDAAADNALKNMSTKLTITKGKYKGGESFRDSIADQQGQQDLHDQQRGVQDEERLAELVSQAQAEFDRNPNDARVLNKLIELLTRQEIEEFENKAIGILVNEFKRTNEYRHKQLADDVRMKQLARAVRKVEKSGDEEVIKQARIASLRFDLTAYKDRVERFPMELRYKFEYGIRLFNAGRFDDAIPVFQSARSDPKNRTICSLYLGRCFYKKNYQTQAINTLQEELASYHTPDDETGKGLLYWLARAQEAAGNIAVAREGYGKILQMDYNYRDVRLRQDKLPP